MLDTKLIREDSASVKKNLARRQDGSHRLVDKFLKKDKEWRRILEKVNNLRSERNKISQEVSRLKKAGKKADTQIKKMETLSSELKKVEEKEVALKEESREILMGIPNLMHRSVPFGKNDTDNVEVKKWGEKISLKFKPKDHHTLLVDLGLIDSETAAEVSGAGFHYLKDDLVLLDLALQRFAIDFLMKKGYTLVNPPYMLRRGPYEGVISFEDFGNVIYKVEDEDLYLIGTSEHPMAATFFNKTLLSEDLPVKFVGVSPCFRKEVGSHGKYTKGLFRMHQFNKVEQFIFCKPEESWKFHEELQNNAEELYEALEIPYQVVNVCTGDLGSIAAKKYDINALMAADGEYREVGSNSNCTDYQARRLNVKYREKEGSPAKGFVHTLNNTAIATSRTMIALIEQHQQKDGTVLIPRALRPYMIGKNYLGK